MIRVRQRHSSSSILLEFSGSFDLRAAEMIVDVALQQPSGVRLVIDLSAATAVFDNALGRLVNGLPRPVSRSIRGKNRHQEKLLSFLGEEIEPPGA